MILGFTTLQKEIFSKKKSGHDFLKDIFLPFELLQVQLLSLVRNGFVVGFFVLDDQILVEVTQSRVTEGQTS